MRRSNVVDLKKSIDEAVGVIRSRTDFEPEVGLILGSGLGDYADQIQDSVVIPYCEIPGFPVSTVSGHAGQFVMGIHQGKRVIAMQGRVHSYEGYPQSQITLPVRMQRFGRFVAWVLMPWACQQCRRRWWPATAKWKSSESPASPIWRPEFWTGSWIIVKWWRRPVGSRWNLSSCWI